MKKKILGMIALIAFAATSVFTVVEASVQQDTIWVYEDDGTTIDVPDCNPALPGICAKEYETFPGTEIPDLSKPTGQELPGQRNP